FISVFEQRTSNAQRPTSNVQHPKETAGGGARTHTALRPLDFESSASANSATPALSRERDDTVSAQKLKYGAICLAALPKLSLTISAKPVEVGAAYQPLILRGERSGLSMHPATTESVSLCVPNKGSQFFIRNRAACKGKRTLSPLREMDCTC